MWLWDWLYELQKKWKVVLIPNVNKLNVSCVYVYACVSALSVFLNSKTLLWENEEQYTVRFNGVPESHFESSFSVDDSPILKVEAVRISLTLVIFFFFFENIWRHILADGVPQSSIRSVALEFTCFLTECILSLPKLNTAGYFECRLSSRKYSGLANLTWVRL